jgi:hypothetical protein
MYDESWKDGSNTIRFLEPFLSFSKPMIVREWPWGCQLPCKRRGGKGGVGRHTEVLKVERWQVGFPDTLRRVFDARLEIILGVLEEERLGFSRLLMLDPLGIAWDSQKTEHG